MASVRQATPLAAEVLDTLPDAVDALTLSLNENPFGPLPAVRSDLIESMDAANRYPQFLPRQLRSLIVGRIGVRDQQVVIGAGATYPAVSAAGSLVAIAHAEHRRVCEQLAVVLRTPRTAPEYADEWRAFVTVLDAHASEEERDLCPPPIELTTGVLRTLGDEMLERIGRLRASAIEKLHVWGRAAILRGL